MSDTIPPGEPNVAFDSGENRQILLDKAHETLSQPGFEEFNAFEDLELEDRLAIVGATGDWAKVDGVTNAQLEALDFIHREFPPLVEPAVEDLKTEETTTLIEAPTITQPNTSNRRRLGAGVALVALLAAGAAAGVLTRGNDSEGGSSNPGVEASAAGTSSSGEEAPSSLETFMESLPATDVSEGFGSSVDYAQESNFPTEVLDTSNVSITGFSDEQWIDLAAVRVRNYGAILSSGRFDLLWPGMTIHPDLAESAEAQARESHGRGLIYKFDTDEIVANATVTQTTVEPDNGGAPIEAVQVSFEAPILASSRSNPSSGVVDGTDGSWPGSLTMSLTDGVVVAYEIALPSE